MNSEGDSLWVLTKAAWHTWKAQGTKKKLNLNRPRRTTTLCALNVTKYLGLRNLHSFLIFGMEDFATQFFGLLPSTRNTLRIMGGPVVTAILPLSRARNFLITSFGASVSTSGGKGINCNSLFISLWNTLNVLIISLGRFLVFLQGLPTKVWMLFQFYLIAWLLYFLLIIYCTILSST